MICISTGNLQKQLGQLNQLKPDLVEIRIDLAGEEVIRLISQLDPSIRRIATCRSGGRVKDTEMVLMRAIESGVHYVDLDLEMDQRKMDRLVKLAVSQGVEVIISWHDFDRTPQRNELIRVMHSCFEKGADVAKIAAMVRVQQDAANLLSLYAEEGRKVVLGMGEAGKITRLAALYLGAEFTFAVLDEADKTAPGQPSYKALQEFITQMQE